MISTIPQRQTVIDGMQRAEPTLAFLDNDTYTRIRNGEKEHNVPKWEWSKAREPSPVQRKKLIALAIMSATRTLLENHLYQFDGTLYRQKKGGPIGNDITRLMAEILMNDFLDKYRAQSFYESLNIDIMLALKEHIYKKGFCLPLA